MNDTEKKAIEEMAVVLTDGGCKECNCDDNGRSNCLAFYEAERLYNAGYRKQSDGEWIQQMRPYDDFIECSYCGEWFNIIDNCTEKFKFCPNRGARMKDGE